MDKIELTSSSLLPASLSKKEKYHLLDVTAEKSAIRKMQSP